MPSPAKPTPTKSITPTAQVDHSSVTTPPSKGETPGARNVIISDPDIIKAIISLTGAPPMAYHMRTNGDLSVVTSKGQKFLFPSHQVQNAL